MAIEWGPHTKASADKLAAAIREVATTPEHHALAARAESGEFTDFSDAHACPISALVNEAQACGLKSIVYRAIDGDFDGTLEESDEWAKSPSGQAVAMEMPEPLRELMGMTVKGIERAEPSDKATITNAFTGEEASDEDKRAMRETLRSPDLKIEFAPGVREEMEKAGLTVDDFIAAMLKGTGGTDA